jgi:23S rRNA pseudouridine1911/1915/1917 synthase
VWHSFRRQALHAASLSLDHPDSAETISVAADLPQDFAALIAALQPCA